MNCPNCQRTLTAKNTVWVDALYNDVVPAGSPEAVHQFCSTCVRPATRDHDIYGRIRYGGPRHHEVKEAAKFWVRNVLMPRRQEYIEWLKVWIVKRNAEYVKRAEHLGTNPLRHKEVVNKVEWLWSDALWCQDVSTADCPAEFYQSQWEVAEPPQAPRGYREDTWSIYFDEAQEFVNECFDVAFREAMPKNLHHVLEG